MNRKRKVVSVHPFWWLDLFFSQFLKLSSNFSLCFGKGWEHIIQNHLKLRCVLQRSLPFSEDRVRSREVRERPKFPSPCSALCQQQLAGHWHGNSSLCFGAETWTFPNRLWPHGCLICTNPQSLQEVSIHRAKWHKTQDKNTSNTITSYFQRRNSIEVHSISVLSSWINMHLV